MEVSPCPVLGAKNTEWVATASVVFQKTDMKVDGLTSIFQVCIVHFLVFWWPGKFWLKKGTGGDPPPG